MEICCRTTSGHEMTCTQSVHACQREIWRATGGPVAENKDNADPFIALPAITGTGRDPQRECVTCKGRKFEIKSDGPYQAWLRCVECGERQPSGAEEP